MTPEQITILVICLTVGLILLIIVPSLFITYKIARKVYFSHFVRTSSSVWGRECSCPSNVEQLEMYNKGMSWAKEHIKNKTDVEITNDGLSLVGEFYNFGHNSTVIIVPGRCESLQYSYFYAIGYDKLPYNILVVDQRAHGLSEGTYSTAGIKESNDILMWAYFLNKTYKQTNIILHGICIGASCAVLASSHKDNPPYIKKVIVDGLFISFHESLKRHTRDEGHPSFPVVNELHHYYKKYAQVDINKYTPMKYINKVYVPILFLHSEKDIYSLPKYARKMYEKCQSDGKELHFFQKGGHSHIRINNVQEYDNTIKEFLNK
jgi:pimeloyl-ACP methyl ester carboxylesterase